MKKLFNSIINKIVKMITKTVLTVCNYRGSGFVDQALIILTSVVIEALVLVGLYKLFGDTVLPTLTQKIQDLFNYAG